jgi:3-keto-disaccharide hydrolase
MIKRLFCLVCSTSLIIILASMPGSAQILLMEDFNDGIADQFTPLDPAWEVVDGEYHVHTEIFNHYAMTLAGDISWQDYVMEFDVLGEGSPDQMFFVRMQDASNFYEINVRTDPWGDAHLFKWVNGVQYFLYSTPISNASAQWNHFKVVPSADEIGLSVNGQFVFSYRDTDSPWLSGGVALVGHCGFTPPYQDIYFDNILVTSFDVIANDDVTWGRVKSLYR